jgi:hypothetical protein
MPEQLFQQARWFQLSAAAFQLAAQVSGRLCSLRSSSRESLALAQLLRRARWFQLSAAVFQPAAQVSGRLCSL